MQLRYSKNDFATLKCGKQFLERNMAMLISRMNVDMAIALRDPGGPNMQALHFKNRCCADRSLLGTPEEGRKCKL